MAANGCEQRPKHGFRIHPRCFAKVADGFSPAADVETVRIEHHRCLRVIDEPIGNARVETAIHSHGVLQGSVGTCCGCSGSEWLGPPTRNVYLDVHVPYLYIRVQIPGYRPPPAGTTVAKECLLCSVRRPSPR